MKLKRFWFRFQSHPPYDPRFPRLGCGVTAYDYEDAFSLLRESIFNGKGMPPIIDVIEVVDITSLDQKHVVPNMEAPVWRGIWFPKGYSPLR